MSSEKVEVTIIPDPPPVKKTRRKSNPPPPPKGNKRALGHGFGRPKTYDPEAEAEALLEWLEQPGSVILMKFAVDRGYSYQRCFDWCESSPVFKDAYDYAKQTIAIRRESLAMAGKIKEGVYHRHQGMYDKYLAAYERAEKEFDASLKKYTKEEAKDLIDGLLGVVEDSKHPKPEGS